jgi:hypothetical protein
MSAPHKVTTDFTLTLNRQMADTGRDFCAVRKFGFFPLCFIKHEPLLGVKTVLNGIFVNMLT